MVEVRQIANVLGRSFAGPVANPGTRPTLSVPAAPALEQPLATDASGLGGGSWSLTKTGDDDVTAAGADFPGLSRSKIS